jgi:hypothetical protein
VPTPRPRPQPGLTDLAQLQSPGIEGLWSDALLVGEDVVEQLLELVDPAAADELIPQEISVNPHQLALKLDERQSRREP